MKSNSNSASKFSQALLAYFGMAAEMPIRQGGLKGAAPWIYRSAGWRQSQRRKRGYVKASVQQKNPRKTRRYRRAHHS